jgi:hypothetical protein
VGQWEGESRGGVRRKSGESWLERSEGCWKKFFLNSIVQALVVVVVVLFVFIVVVVCFPPFAPFGFLLSLVS